MQIEFYRTFTFVLAVSPQQIPWQELVVAISAQVSTALIVLLESYHSASRVAQQISQECILTFDSMKVFEMSWRKEICMIKCCTILLFFQNGSINNLWELTILRLAGSRCRRHKSWYRINLAEHWTWNMKCETSWILNKNKTKWRKCLVWMIHLEFIVVLRSCLTRWIHFFFYVSICIYIVE